MSEEETKPAPQQDNRQVSLGEDFSEDYANNFNFELSAWDFKVLFGQLDQTRSGSQINWHTAITMPWGVAKIMSHYLAFNIAAYEIQNGRIQIPKAVMPPEPTPPSGPDDNEQTRLLYQMMLTSYRALVGEQARADRPEP